MKNIIIILIILLLLNSFLYSCDKNKNTSMDNDPYIYRYDENYHTIIRLGLLTNTVTTVCTDPLCSHADENCPFYGAMSCSENNNKIYYAIRKEKAASEITSEKIFIEYDLAANKPRVITKLSLDNFSSLFYDYENGFIYFKTFIENKGEIKNPYARIKINSGNVEYFYDYPENSIIVGADSGGVYIRDIINRSVIYTDNKFTPINIVINDIDYAEVKNSYLTCGTINSSVSDGNTYSIYKLNKGMATLDVSFENVGLFTYYYDNKLFFLKTSENPELVYTDSYNSDYYNTYGGRVYMLAPDGNTNAIFDDPKIDITSIIGVSNGKIACCVGGVVQNTAGDEFYSLCARYIIIDIGTYEYTVIG